VVFNKAPAPGQVNLSPYAGLQFFGEVNIDRKTQAMTVDLKDIEGDVVFSQTLPASQHSNKGHDRD
jgi:alkaline phosphatase D